MRAELLRLALQERILMVIGSRDTGKTTMIKDLANALFERGYSVGVIDADVGQSDIGPPTTIGLGTVETVLAKLSDVVLRHFYFVGSISPKGHILSMVIGVRKMLDKALELGLQKILIDTTGLVDGQMGRVLKEHKIAAVNPDVIVCLQANQECEHILRVYDAFEKPGIIRLTPDHQCCEKTLAARRNFRETALQQAFVHAQDIICSLSAIGVFETTLFSGQPLEPQKLQELVQTLESRLPVSSFEFQILWGELLGKELHLVTSRELGYDHFLKIKQHWPPIAYVKNYTLAEFENMLIGILNKNNEFCALGVLKSIDFAARQAIIYTSAVPQDIAGVKFSKYIIQETIR
jgi:polynucleotide 5'-hydroxyl-kinase GRC3/NOL9